MSMEARSPAQPLSRRERVYQRDGYQCLRCGSPEDLTLDHIKPVSHGGVTKRRNLQTLCASCNVLKDARRVDYRPTAKASPYHVSKVGDVA